MTDEDALHELIARHGPEILDREFPYIIVAARNQLRSRLRRTNREIPTLGEVAPMVDESSDPASTAAARGTIRSLLQALALFDDRDVLVLWRQAQGVPDQEVAAEWDARGYLPVNPTGEVLRKRRERARKRLKEALGGEILDILGP